MTIIFKKNNSKYFTGACECSAQAGGKHYWDRREDEDPSQYEDEDEDPFQYAAGMQPELDRDTFLLHRPHFGLFYEP